MIFCIVLGFFAGKSCVKPDVIDNSTHTTDTIVKTDTIIDSIPYPVKEIELIPYKVVETKTDTIIVYRDMDSTDVLELYKDYFLKRFYDPTIVNDSNARIKVKFEVTENKAINFRVTEMVFFTKTLKSTNIVTNTIKHRGMIALGIGVGYYPMKSELPLAGKIKYLDNKFRIYGASFNPFQEIYEFEASFPVFRW